MTDDRLAQAQAHIDAIKARAESDLSALRDAAASAKERVENGISELRTEFDPEPEREPDLQNQFGDENPTIEVDMPEEFSFTDFDPGVPDVPAEERPPATEGEPAVRFDDNDITTDDDGIPIWEDPA